MPQFNDILWRNWINENLSELQRGKRIKVPSYLPHPKVSGAENILLAEYVGQKADYSFSFPRGYRIHVHEFDNEFVAHCDHYDPSRGFVPMLKHFALETRTGKIVAIALLIAIFFGFNE